MVMNVYWTIHLKVVCYFKQNGMKKILFTLICCCSFLLSDAQITLIDPTAGGGFESGTFFGANGWTLVGFGPNRWAIGNGIVNTGLRSAYIGNASTFVGTATPAINHFYSSAPINIPATASNILLSFRYAQPVVDFGNDSFIVSIGFASDPTPVSGSTIQPMYNRVYTNTAAAYPGFVEVGPIDLSVYNGTSIRVVFTHVNNGSGAQGIPAVDSISLTYCNIAGVTGTNMVCPTDTVQFACSASGGTWSSSNTAVATVDATSGIVTGVATGTASISYILGGCFSVRNVTVNPQPSAIFGDISLCLGDTATLYDTTVGGVWSSSDAATVPVSSTGFITGSTVGTATISYRMPAACWSLAEVTVNPFPTAFNVTGGGVACASGAGVPVGVDSSELGVDYSISDGTSVVATSSGTGFPFDISSISTAGSYTVSAANATSGCTSDMTGSVTVTIGPAVVPAVTITPPITLVCTGGSGTYTANPVNEGPTPSYQWYVNGTATGTGTSYSYAPVAGDVVSVTLYPGGICVSPDSATGNHTPIITAYTAPSVTSAVSPGNPSCTGAVVTMSAVPMFGGSAPTYIWTKNGINVATGPTYSFLPTGGDVVYCTMTSNYSCRTIDTAVSPNTLMVTEAGSAAPDVTVSAFPTGSISLGDIVSFTATVTGGAPSVSYQWILNGVAIPGATAATHSDTTFTDGDIVTCEVTNMDACAKSTLKSVLLPVPATGVNGIVKPTSLFSLAPNPNRGDFTVTGNAATTLPLTLTVTNMVGQTVYTQTIAPQAGAINQRISIGNMPVGMYLLSIKSDSVNELHRFVLTN